MKQLPRKFLLGSIAEATLIAALLLAAIFLYRPGLYAAGSRMDEATLLVYPQLVSKGKMAYRDFETFYGPANLQTLAAVFRFCGATVKTERAVGIAYRLTLLAALYLAARRWGKTASAGSVVIAMFALLPLGLAANAWIIAVALALGSVTLLARSLTLPAGGWMGPAAAGCLAGIAILFRIDLAPAALAPAVLLFFLLRSMEWRSYAIGLLLGCSPLLFWIVGAGARLIVENLFLYPVIYSNPARRLPLLGQDAVFLGAIIGAASLIFLCGAFAVRIKRADPGSFALLALGCLSILATPQAIQRADYFHAAMSAPVTVGLLPVLLAALMQLAGKRALAPWLAGLMTVACLSVFFSICPKSAEIFDLIVHDQLAVSEISECTARAGAQKFPLSSAQDAQAATRICAAIARQSVPGQRLFVGPSDLRRANYNDVYFYYLLPQLEPASYFVEMNPMSANRVNSRLAGDIATADWIILDSQLNAFHEANTSEHFGPDAPMLVVRDHFVQVAQLDQFSIFKRRPD
jgi:hypothetical protein